MARMLCFCLGVVTLAACQVSLYSSLPEEEINQMLAILLQNGIQGDKIAGKDNVYSLTVDEKDIENAIILLKNHGYPREVFSGIGTVFKQESRIASQLEQQARLNFALTQDLSATLSQIDGVLSARVHVPIVTPTIGGGSDEQPSEQSAAAFIRYDERYDLESLVPHIKGLLSKGLSNVTYSNISVVLVPITPTPITTPIAQTTETTPSTSDEDTPLFTRLTVFFLAGFLCLSVIVNMMLWRRRQQKKPETA